MAVEGEVPKQGKESKEGVPSEMSLRMERVLEKSNVRIEQESEKKKLSESLMGKVRGFFEGEKFDLKGSLDEVDIAAVFVSALSAKLTLDDLKKDYPSLDDSKKFNLFIENISKIMARNVKKEILSKYEILKGEKSIAGVFNIGIEIKADGTVEVELGLDSDLEKTLAALPNSVSELEEAVKSTVSDILGSPDFYKTLGETEESYPSIISIFDKGSEKILKLLAKLPGMKDNKIFALEKYSGAILQGVKEGFMKKIDEAMKGALGSDFNPEIAKKLKVKFKVKYDGSEVKVEIGDEYKAEYKKAAVEHNYPEEVKERVKGMKEGMMGWILEALGFDDEDYAKLASGKHPLAFLLGALSFSSGGAMFLWARPSWEKVRNVLSKDPRGKRLVSSVEGAAEKVSGIIGKFEDNTELFEKADKKKNEEIEKMSGVKVGKKGIQFLSEFPLKAKYKSVQLTVPKGGQVIFPEMMKGIKKDGNLLKNARVLTEGVYEVADASFLKGSYFSSGVQLDLEEKV